MTRVPALLVMHADLAAALLRAAEKLYGPVDDVAVLSNEGLSRADLEEFAYSNKSPDPTTYMKAWTCDEAAQKANDWSKSNWSRYCNPAYDALWAEVARELDPGKRATLFRQMNDFLVDDGAVIPLVHLADQSGASSTLQGLDLTPWDLEPWNIADWTRGG